MIEIGNFVLGAILILCMTSCSQKSKVRVVTDNTNNAQAGRSSKIKDSWEQSCKSVDQQRLGREYPGKKLDLLIEILQQTQESKVNAERERIRTDPKPYDKMDEYDRYLLQSLFLISAKAKDRNALVYLLSAKCPRFIANSPVELEVASLEIDHAFLIMFDSYDKAVNGEQDYLLDILRHAFKGLSANYPDDTAFVRASRAWYLENYAQIEPNPYYHPFVNFVEQKDLFVRKK
jgi:hypothetical protein